jgi:hypothetical protein
MAEKYCLCVDCLTVTRGGVKRTYARGDDVSELPSGVLGPLVRLQKVSPTPPPTPTVGPEIEVEPAVVPSAPEADWRDAPVASLGLSVHVEEALLAANLQTVREVIAYGAENGGSLVSLKGIGAASERAIQEAIEAIIPKE